jgi:hypothetical protein
MSNQVKCPNCGGYKITSQKTPIKQKIALSESERRAMRILGLIIFVPMLGLSILACLVATVFGSDLGTSLSGGFYTFCTIIIVASLAGLLGSLFQSNVTKVVGHLHHFTCILCGYRWDWQEGQPWPKVHVDPDLIAKGEQRLAEEERRRQEEAALYYLSKQGKK